MLAGEGDQAFSIGPELARAGAEGVGQVLAIGRPKGGRVPQAGRWKKEVLDRGVAAFFLLIGSPLFLTLALGVKLTSRGPVLFKQRRHGLMGEEILVYKFRTMVQHHEPPGVVTQATRGDSRVTWLGQILRQTSLDELPQLINVLQGTMSLVGPRPHALEHNWHYSGLIPRYNERNRMKPGITGWAQINGHRGPTQEVGQMAARVEHDLWYIENWSFWLDIKILAVTAHCGFVHENAH